MRRSSASKRVLSALLSVLLALPLGIVPPLAATAATTATTAGEPAAGEITINVITDIHEVPPSALNGNLITPNDAVLDKVIANHPDVLLVTGDISRDGERDAAEAMAAKLERVKAAGIKVFVMNGNHDINNSDPKTSVSQFRNIFADFGYSGSDGAVYYQPLDTPDSEHIQGGLSYIISPKPGVKILMIDSEDYLVNRYHGMISDGLLAWILEQVRAARENGDTLIACMHHPFLTQYTNPDLVAIGGSDDYIDNNLQIAEQLADAGLKYVFTGHEHEQDIAEYTSLRGNKILQMLTGSPDVDGFHFPFITSATVSKDDITLQTESLGVCQYNGNTVNATDVVNRGYFSKAAAESNLMDLINGELNGILGGGDIAYLAESLGGIDISQTLVGSLKSALAEPLEMTVPGDPPTPLKISYAEDSDPALLIQVQGTEGIPDYTVRISIENDLLPALDDLYGKLNHELFDNHKLTDSIHQMIVNALDTDVYQNGDTTKKFYDFVGALIHAIIYGNPQQMEPWVAQTFEALKLEVPRKLASDAIVPEVKNLLADTLGSVSIDSNILIKAQTPFAASIKNLIGSGSCGDFLALLGLDLNGAVDDLATELLGDDSTVGAIGNGLYGFAAGFLIDSPGMDDEADGPAVAFHIDDADPNAHVDIDIKDLTLGVGSSESELRAMWYSTSAFPGTLQLANKTDKPADTDFPADPAKYSEYTATLATVGSPGYYGNNVVLTGLQANTDYIYRVGNEGVWDEVRSFRTKDFGDNFSFLLAGDPQIGSSGNVGNDTAGWTNTLNKAMQWFPGVSFLVSAGDQVENYNNETQYDGFFAPDALRSLTLAPNIGNHDSPGVNYKQHFSVPNAATNSGDTAAGGDYWYSYNHTLFMSINSNNLSTAQHQAFLTSAIAAYKAQNGGKDPAWKIVTFHHSVYSVADHTQDSDILQRRSELPVVFSNLGIDAVLMGHDHSYTRSLMMNGTTPITTGYIANGSNQYESYTQNTSVNGVLYLTANSASGSKYYAIRNLNFPFVAVDNQENTPNITKIDVSTGSLTFTTYRTGASNSVSDVVDTFTLNKTLAVPTVSSVSLSPSAATVQQGDTKSFSAAVTGTNSPAQTVTWSVSGNTSSGTTIDGSGLLTVGADETAATLTVKATSTVDATKYGTASVSVTTIQIPPTDKTLSGIVMQAAPAKTTYVAGQSLDLAGATIKLNYSDSSYDVIAVTASMVSGYDSAKTGKQTLTVTYQSKTATFDINVIPATISNEQKTATADVSGTSVPNDVTSLTLSAQILPTTGSGSEKAAFVQKLLSSDAKGLVVYDLKLLDQNGNPVEPTGGSVKVKLPIPEGLSGDLHVYWYDSANNRLVDMNATVEDGYLVFETTHFSDYAIVQLATSTTSGTADSPNTGDSSNPILPIALVAIILPAAGVMFGLRKKGFFTK